MDQLTRRRDSPIGYDSEFQTILRVVRTENGFDTKNSGCEIRPLIPAEVGEWMSSLKTSTLVHAFDVVRMWQLRMAS